MQDSFQSVSSDVDDRDEDAGEFPAQALKVKDLVARVVEQTGQRKGEVRRTVQAVLGVLSEALAADEELNVAPLGKLKVTRRKTTERGQVTVVKLVQNGKLAPADHPIQRGLAASEEDS